MSEETPLKIVSANAASLRAAWKKGFPEFVQKSNPDILCIQETKLHENCEPNIGSFIIEGYQGYFFNCERPGLHGTAIYTKIKPVSVNISFPDDEGRCITMEFTDFYLVNTYVPNAGMKLERLKYKIETWNPRIKAHLDELSKKKTTIWTGDLNVAHEPIDIFDTKGKDKVAGYTPEERKWFHEFLESGYTDVFRNLYPEKKEFTYYSYRFNAKALGRGWRVDYFVIDNAHYNKENIVDCAMESCEFSDHVPHSLLLKRSILKETDVKVEKAFNTRLNDGHIFDTLVEFTETKPKSTRSKKSKKDEEDNDEANDEAEEKPKQKTRRGKKAKEEEETVKEDEETAENNDNAEEAEEKPKPKTRRGKKTQNDEESKEEAEETNENEEKDEESEEKTSKKRTRRTKKETKVEEEKEDENEDDQKSEEEEEKPKPKSKRAKATRASPRRRSTRQRRKRANSSDEDSDDSNFGESD